MRQCKSCNHSGLCKYEDAMRVAQEAAMEIEALTTDDLRLILYPHSIPTIRCKRYEGENLAIVAAREAQAEIKTHKETKQSTETKMKPKKAPGKQLTDSQFEEALLLYKKGIGPKEIWRKMELTCAYTTLYTRLKNEERKPKVDPGERNIDLGKVRALYNAGWDVRSIAGDMGKNEKDIQTAIERLRKEEA